MTEFRTLDQVRAVADPGERSQAVSTYNKRLDEMRSQAARVRHDAIAEVLEANGRALWNQPAKVANRCGVSVSTVKAVRATR